MHAFNELMFEDLELAANGNADDPGKAVPPADRVLAEDKAGPVFAGFPHPSCDGIVILVNRGPRPPAIVMTTASARKACRTEWMNTLEV